MKDMKTQDNQNISREERIQRAATTIVIRDIALTYPNVQIVGKPLEDPVKYLIERDTYKWSDQDKDELIDLIIKLRAPHINPYKIRLSVNGRCRVADLHDAVDRFCDQYSKDLFRWKGKDIYVHGSIYDFPDRKSEKEAKERFYIHIEIDTMFSAEEVHETIDFAEKYLGSDLRNWKNHTIGTGAH